MALIPGTCLGPYEITAQIGAGGMGEVYRATDTNLARHVAIKVLPASVAADPERLARFDREAKTLAALNHPNIAQIHGLEKSDGTVALVMELVEGDDLSQRIARGAIPVDEALPIAKQIAGALEAAHEQGIIHRDLKPANIKVRADGTVKVLDFGLAKAMEPAGVMLASNSQSPTISTPAMTQAGMILGTAAYMSPEQARGKPVDKRADIWAFGCVLYEMLAGRRAFGGDDVQETFVAIMRDEPDWARLPAILSPTLGTYLRRCLDKDPKQRVGDIRDVRLALEGAFDPPAAPSDGIRSRSAAARALPWALAALGGAAVLAALAVFVPNRPAPVDVPVMRFVVTPPAGGRLSSTPAQMTPLISPDGRRLAFTASDPGAPGRLWIRSLDAVEPEAVASAPGVSPFWSPGSRRLAFFASEGLQTADGGGGGPVQTVQPTLQSGSGASLGGGAWNAEGAMLVGGVQGGINRVLPDGTLTAVTTPGPATGASSHRFPTFLPDGRHFVYWATPSNALWLGSLDGTPPRQLVASDAQGQYAAGHLLFVRQSTVLAQPFDPDRLTLSGEATPVASAVPIDAYGRAAFSASDTGTLVYRTGAVGGQTQLTWVNRQGQSVGTVGPPALYRNPALSPDGSRVAVEVTDPGTRTQDIWLVDVARGVSSRFTFDPHNDLYPIWTRDGRGVVFSSDRDGSLSLYQKPADGSAPESVLLALDARAQAAPYGWSADGRLLVYRSFFATGGLNTALVALTGDRTPRPLFPLARYTQAAAEVSPDGHWVAYVSIESGRPEVFVQRFPPPGGKYQISKDGAVYERWRGDGGELYYGGYDDQLWAVPVTGDTALTIGAPKPLFRLRILNGHDPVSGFRAQYDVAADGQRFLVNTPLDDAGPSDTAITVVLNWPAALKR